MAAFIDEGDLPESDDSTFERAYTVIKYMGTTRQKFLVACHEKGAAW